MQWTSIIAIYCLFLSLSFFLVLPFGVKTHEEAGIEKIPGQADSAPAHFHFGRVFLRAAILAAVLFGLFYANYVNGWISAKDLDLLGEGAGSEGRA